MTIDPLYRLIPVLFMGFIHPAASAVGNDEARLRTANITTIVIHSIGGPDCDNNGDVVFTGAPGDAKRWIKYFEDHKIVSIHYIVDRAGNVEASVHENRVATHAYGSNSKSIGIELVNRGDGKDPFPEEQLTALVKLVKEIKGRHSSIERIVRHSDVDSRTFPCGGRDVAKKQDPGPGFPFEDFLSRVGQ